MAIPTFRIFLSLAGAIFAGRRSMTCSALRNWAAMCASRRRSVWPARSCAALYGRGVRRTGRPSDALHSGSRPH